MLLSKVTLNPRHRQTYHLLSDLYAQHRFVMSAFPDARDMPLLSAGTQDSQGVLYRLELPKNIQAPFFLVQSPDLPDWKKTGDLHRQVVCGVETGERNPTPSEGVRYRFRLRANPTACRVRRDASGSRQKSCREGLFTEYLQREWLARAGERGGFQVNPEAVIITPRGKLTGIKAARPGEHTPDQVTCFAVDFDGTLFVTQTERFSASLREGIGRGKAWGCGLLSLIRA